ncbi:MAG: LysR family transcriptional regulator [Bacteriovoracaceae bacterium]
MEIFELRYFLAVAAVENIHKASEKMHVSPAALSKAITRLEAELSIKLFTREGRNIQITDQGRLLQKRASEIIQLEEATKLELVGNSGGIQVVLSGPEILLSHAGMKLTQDIKKRFPQSNFEYLSHDDDIAIEKVVKGEAHFAIVTSDISPKLELRAKVIGETNFLTFVGLKHPLYPWAKSKKAIPVKEVLKHTFVSPNNPLLGKVGLKQSLDGWRDDRFPRKVDYLTSSLKSLETILLQGKAIAYLPDYFGETLSVLPLNISDCPYSCQQKIKLVARDHKSLGWINQIF